MKKYHLIENILCLPTKFYTLGNSSFFSLLKETGYFELHNKVSKENIFKVLVRHQDYINQWLSWSEGKRNSSGWYIQENENGKYIVGYYSAEKKLKTIEYSDVAEACAYFIKQEIEDIRKSL